MRTKLFNEVDLLIRTQINNSEKLTRSAARELVERRHDDVMKRIKDITDKIGKPKADTSNSYSLMRTFLMGSIDSSIEDKLLDARNHIQALHEQIKLLHQFLNVQPAKTVERKYLKKITKPKK